MPEELIDTRVSVEPGLAELGESAKTGWRMVGLLAVSQTVGYGVLYYSFSVFLAPMAASLHAGTTAVTGALTASLLAGAAAAVPVGRWLDRHGGRGLMAWGSVAATVLVLAWSRVPSLAALYAVWIGIGLASAAVLYEAAFAVVVSWFDAPRRANALLAVTVVAGFASSIFLPLSGWLNEAYGWRTGVLVLGAVHAVVTIPLHLLIRAPERRLAAGRSAVGAEERRRVVAGALRDPVYWLLGGAFVAQATSVSVFAVLLVSVLHALGHSAGFSAAVAGLLGVLSVTGRLATTAATGRWSTASITAWVFVVQGAGALLMAHWGRGTVGAIGCVLAFGLGFGVATIARPALLADRYGTAGYATLSATLSVPLTLVKALAPLAAALVWHVFGLQPLLDALATCCVVGAAGLLAAQRLSAVARVGS